MSPTIILKGCMAMLMLVSRNISEKRPNHMAIFSPRNTLVEKCKLPALGRKAITSTAIMAPINRYGLRRPILHHVRSLHLPISGCTIMPMSGGRIQKKLNWCGSAPRVANMRDMLALCSAYAIWTPK